MFARKRKIADQASRSVVLVIKTTNSHNYNPKEGDRITQIACVEMMDGNLTGKEFNAFINPNNQQLLTACGENYRQNLRQDEATALLSNVTNAPIFKDIQPLLLAFISHDPTTTIIVHQKKHVLHFLRHELDAHGNNELVKFPMESMISKAAELSHQGLYHAGQYPAEISSNREKLSSTRTYYKFDDICKELNVSTRLRTGYSALQDATLLAKAEGNRLTLVPADQKQAEVNRPLKK